MLLPTGTLLVMLATVCVAFARIGTAAVVGGVGIWLLLRCSCAAPERRLARCCRNRMDRASSTGPLCVYGTL